MAHVHTRAAAVIRLIDAVTERAVQYRDIQIQTVQQHKVIWKDTGCAVILAQDRGNSASVDRIDALISGKFYREMQLHIDLTTDPTPKVYPVWLQPSGCYPFQEDMTVIECTQNLADELYILWSGERYKLAETTTAGAGCLSLWGVDGVMEGRMLLLCEDSGIKELVTIVGQLQDDVRSYCTREPIRHVFYRGRTKVYKVLRVHTDGSGNFLAALRRGARQDGKILFWSGRAEEGFFVYSDG